MIKQNFAKFFLIFILICFAFFSQAQNISFVTSANAEKIENLQYRTYLGDYFEVSFMVMNGVGKNFVAPNLKDFNIVSGPNAYNVEQITNGNRLSKYGYNYTLQPKKSGRFLITPAKIDIDGTVYQSNPIAIEVVKDNVSSKNSKNEPIVLRIKTDKNEYFVGEQINLTFQLLSTVAIQNYEITNQPDLKEFIVEPVQLIDREISRERYNGKTYQAVTLEKKILFAQKSGQIDIASIAANMMIETQESGFGGVNIPSSDMISAESQAIHLTINDLPVGVSDAFSGAIGTWELELKSNKTELSTDETLVLELLIKGNGDPKRVIAPRLKLSDSLEVYEPKIIEEGIGIDANGSPLSYKKIEYLVVPRYAGNFTIQANLNYFDIAEKNYLDIKTSPLTISVSQGKGIVKIDDKKDTTESKSTFFQSKNIFYALGGLIFTSLLFYFLAKRKKKTPLENAPKQGEIAEIETTSITTPTVVSASIKSIVLAEKNLQEENFSDFYKNIYNTLVEKINQHFQIPSAEISEATIATKLTLLGVQNETAQNIQAVLRTCNMARFAAKIDVEEADLVLAKTKKILEIL